jgi:CheY-like chemotaxis protein
MVRQFAGDQRAGLDVGAKIWPLAPWWLQTPAILADRSWSAFATPPIIAVPARAMPRDKEESIAAGASDYVTKPVDTDELPACTERWLSQR